MRVFVTGASGHVGSALVPELQRNGHQVVGLARSPASAAALEAAGVEVRHGSLDDLALLRATAAECDGVVHLAFKHDVAFVQGDYVKAATDDVRAIEALGEGLVGSNKPFVGTGGTLQLAAFGRLSTEDDVLPSGPRVDAERLVIGLAERGVRSSVVRLAPTVHSHLDRMGFVPVLIAAARQHGFAAYVGEGTSRWPALHTLDAARLYRLALESAPPGTRLHGCDEEGVTTRDIAEAIARGVGLAAKSIGPEEAPRYLGFLAGLAQLDNPTSSARTRAVLSWEPREPRLLADLASGHYFAAPPARG